MSYEIQYEDKVSKYLKKLSKTMPKIYAKISIFLDEELPNCENPCALQSAKRLKNFKDNRWRWRLGDWRIIGIVENGELKILKIIQIARRNEKTYKDN